jgi:hypothetical protein
VLKAKGTIRLTVRDIFYTQAMEGFTYSGRRMSILKLNVIAGFAQLLLTIVLVNHTKHLREDLQAHEMK